MAGDILLVCKDPGDEKLVRDAMRATNVSLTNECDPERAVALVHDPGFDFAFVYNNLTQGADEPEDGKSGLDMIQRVRCEGMLMPMVLINDRHDQDLRMAAIAAGAVEMLAKPIAWDALYQAAGEFLSEFTTEHENQLEADLSSLSSAVAQGEVDGDPAALTETCFNLSRSVLKSEEEEVNNLLRILELTAKGMRCNELALHARETVNLLHRTHTCQSLHPRVRVLTRMSRTLSKVA
jgi:DNA-binding response OmpR family regulator